MSVPLADFQSLPQNRHFPELSSHFSNHAGRRTAHGSHRHCREQKWHHGPDEQSTHNTWVGHIDRFQAGSRHVGAEQRQCRQSGGTDGKSLADGRSRIPHGIQLVSASANIFGQATHLGNTTRVVRNRTVRINRQLNPGIGKHAHRGNRDPVQPSQFVCTQNRKGNQQHRDGCRQHPHSKTGDYVGRCTGH